MTSRIWKNMWVSSLVSIGIILLIIFLYAIAHESGHAIAVLLFGGEVTRFDVNYLVSTPSIGYIGITDPMQRAVISLAGPLLPLLFLPLLGTLLPKAKHTLLRSALLGLLIGLLSTIVTSIIIAAACGLGAKPYSQDVAKFILYSGAPSFIVAGAFLLLLIVALVFLLRLGVKEVVREQLLAISRSVSSTKHNAWVTVLIVVVILFIGTIAMMNTVDHEPSHSALSFQTKLSLDFSGPTQVYTFQVQEPTTYDFVYSLNTNSAVTLRLINLDGAPLAYTNQASIVMYQGSEDIQNAYFTGFTLPAGNYAVEILTAGQGSITMQIGTAQPDAVQLQYLALLEQVNNGTFTAESYQESGYTLLYHQEIKPGTDQLLVTLPGTNKQRQVSVFVVGDYEGIEVAYVADGERRTLLNGSFSATIGYGLPAHKTIGEFRLTAVETDAELYLFLREDD